MIKNNPSYNPYFLKGFTIVEVVFVMFIMSVLLYFANEILLNSNNTFHTLWKKYKQNADLVYFSNQIKSDLQNVKTIESKDNFCIIRKSTETIKYEFNEKSVIRKSSLFHRVDSNFISNSSFWLSNDLFNFNHHGDEFVFPIHYNQPLK